MVLSLTLDNLYFGVRPYLLYSLRLYPTHRSIHWGSDHLRESLELRIEQQVDIQVSPQIDVQKVRVNRGLHHESFGFELLDYFKEDLRLRKGESANENVLFGGH